MHQELQVAHKVACVEFHQRCGKCNSRLPIVGGARHIRLRHQIDRLRRHGAHKELHGEVFGFCVEEGRCHVLCSRIEPSRLDLHEDDPALLVGGDFQRLGVVDDVGDFLSLYANEVDVIARERMRGGIGGRGMVCKSKSKRTDTGERLWQKGVLHLVCL